MSVVVSSGNDSKDVLFDVGTGAEIVPVLCKNFVLSFLFFMSELCLQAPICFPPEHLTHKHKSTWSAFVGRPQRLQLFQLGHKTFPSRSHTPVTHITSHCTEQPGAPADLSDQFNKPLRLRAYNPF